MEKIIEYLKKIIISNFPTLKILIEYDKDDNEYFMIVDKSDIYSSSKFANLIFNLKFDYLKNKGITNIFIVCEPDKFLPEYFENMEFGVNDEIDMPKFVTPLNRDYELTYQIYNIDKNLHLAA